MKNIVLFSLLLISDVLKAQVSSFINHKGEKITEERLQMGDEIHRVSYKGSVYFNEKFDIANITMRGGKQIVAPIRFNTYKNEIVALINSENYTITDADFTFREHQFIRIKKEFYEVIFEKDNLKLLKQYKTTLLEDTSNGDNFLRGTSSNNIHGDVYLGEFINKVVYLFQFEGDRLVEFDLKKKSIISALKKGKSDLFTKFEESNEDFSKIETIIDLLE